MILRGSNPDPSQLSHVGSPGGKTLGIPSPGSRVSLRGPRGQMRLPQGGGSVRPTVLQSAIKLPKQAMFFRVLTDAGVGTDLLAAPTLARMFREENGFGFDAISDLLRIVVRDSAAGLDWITAEAGRMGVLDTAVGLDLAANYTRIDPFDSGVGIDLSLTSWPAQHGISRAAGLDLALAGLINLQGFVSDLAAGRDSATDTAVLSLFDEAAAADLALRQQQVAAWDAGAGLDRATFDRADLPLADPAAALDTISALIVAIPPVNGDHAAGLDDRSAGYTSQTDVFHVVTETGYISIPVWARYVDVVLLGAGAGGDGGGQSVNTGSGGAPGGWATNRWDRGASRNTWRRLSLTIGTGGNGGAAGGIGENKDGSPGGATTMQIEDWSGQVGQSLSAAGGSGNVSGQNGGAVSPLTTTFNNISATGGNTSTGDTATVPGAGGRGGGGSAWPLGAGSGRQGARGQAWIRFST